MTVAIARTRAAFLEEPDPPEFVLVMPRQAEGWLKQKAMDAARVRLARQIAKADTRNCFRIYVPVTRNGADIYVHAKVSIVDDRLLRVGSSNLNNRSLGLDSECDVIIDAGLEGNQKATEEIARLRVRLIAEHLAVEPETFLREFERFGSLIGAIDHLRGAGKTLELLDLTQPGPFRESRIRWIAYGPLGTPVMANDSGLLQLHSNRGAITVHGCSVLDGPRHRSEHGVHDTLS